MIVIITFDQHFRDLSRNRLTSVSSEAFTYNRQLTTLWVILVMLLVMTVVVSIWLLTSFDDFFMPRFFTTNIFDDSLMPGFFTTNTFDDFWCQDSLRQIFLITFWCQDSLRQPTSVSSTICSCWSHRSSDDVSSWLSKLSIMICWHHQQQFRCCHENNFPTDLHIIWVRDLKSSLFDISSSSSGLCQHHLYCLQIYCFANFVIKWYFQTFEQEQHQLSSPKAFQWPEKSDPSVSWPKCSKDKTQVFTFALTFLQVSLWQQAKRAPW